MRSDLRLAPLLALVLVNTSGCFLKLNESPAQDTSMEVAGLETACMDGVGAKFGHFLDGQTTDAEIASIWDCMRLSLDKFATHTRGGAPDSYSFEELRSFLHRYFLKDMTISDTLLREAAELKRVAVGGTAERLTRDEITRSREFFAVVKREMIRMRPYMPLTRVRAASLTPPELEAGITALQEAAGNLARQLDSSGQGYSFKRLESLSEQLKPYWPGEAPSRLLRRLPLIGEIKAALFSTSRDHIAAREWPELLDTAVQWFSVALRYSYLDSHFPEWTHGEGRERYVAILAQARGLLEQAVDRNPEQTLRFAQLNRVIRALEDDDLPAKKEKIIEFLVPMFRNMLGGLDGGPNGRDALGLTRSVLTRGWEAVLRWSEGQRYLEGTFRRVMARVGRILPRGLKEQSFSPSELLGVPTVSAMNYHDGTVTRIGKEVAADLRKVIAHDRPFFRGSDTEAFFPGPLGGDRRHSFHNLSEINWMRVMGRILIQGYARDRKRAEESSGCTIGELHRFIEDVRPLLVDMLWIDPRRKPEEDDLHTKRFMEANLFSYSANGDQYFSLDEGSELIAFMLSSKRLSQRTHRDLMGQCQTGADDPFGFGVIEPNCYRRQFVAGAERYWDHMPALTLYFNRLSTKEQFTYVHMLEESARRSGYSQEWFESGDTEGLSALAAYLESLVARFDRNGTGTLDVEEAKDAFKIFRRILSEKTGYTDPDFLWGLFSYMLANGEPPDQDIGGGLSFWWWRQREFMWSFEADRMTVLKIFSQMGKLSRKSH